MNRKIVLMSAFGFLFLALMATQAIASVRAETGTSLAVEPPALPEAPNLPKWCVDGNGTVFQITNSSYLNVTLTSSESVHVFLKSVPRVVSYGIESLSSATSTMLTLSGFVPSSTYYRYQDGNLTESFVADSAGNYAYVQDISSRHHVFIVENMSTIYIEPDGTVYSDTGEPVPISVSVVDGIYTYTFTDNIYDSIVVQRDNIVIDGNGCNLEGWEVGGGVGFYLSGRSGVTIKNVTVYGWSCGIWLVWSSGNVISGNTISNIYYPAGGIELDWSSGNTISDNDITNNMIWPYGQAIWLGWSSGNVISGNNITNNDGFGIVLCYSSGNTISGNNINQNIYVGIWLPYESSSNTITNNCIANNNEGGIIGSSDGTTISGNNITNNQDGVGIYGSGNTISGNNITDNGVGVGIVGSGNTILGNNITNNNESWGVNIWGSGNTISGNNITNNNGIGIELDWSSGNTISGNNITANIAGGIVLGSCSGDTITNNWITNNNGYGIFQIWSDGTTISGNTIANNLYMGGFWWLWSWWDVENLNGGGVVLVDSSGNTISGNNITNNFSQGGVSLDGSNGNTISSNNITNNQAYWENGGGVVLAISNDNTISDNNITNNERHGIAVWGSIGSLIFHNNIIDNTVQAYDDNPAANDWHHPVLLEGNYWSDYPGYDDGSGTAKHAIAGDGIGDTDIPWPGTDYDYYPFTQRSRWVKKIQYYLTVQTYPPGIAVIAGEGWYDVNTVVNLNAPTEVAGSTGVRYIFDHWAVDGNVVSGNPISVQMDSTHTATAVYNTQYYLTVISPYDLPGGEGWYTAGETAYATLQTGLEYVDGLAYGFTGWTVDTQPWGWDLLSEPIIMNSPKTATAQWEGSPIYGDVRTIGFWKHQVNVWYFTELAQTGMNIRGIGTAQVSEDALITYLTFIDTNSDYFKGKIVKDNDGDGAITNLEILQNAYNFLKTPTDTESMKMRAEQQLLALWLNLAHKAFFWNTQLSQDTLYTYWQHTYDNVNGLATIGEAIQFCEAELLKPDGNYEAAKNICDSINNNLGIIWGT